jgi:O-antigen/teichoic acid export membrane protein
MSQSSPVDSLHDSLPGPGTPEGSAAPAATVAPPEPPAVAPAVAASSAAGPAPAPEPGHATEADLFESGMSRRARKLLRLDRAFFGAACISLQPVILSALMLPATAYVIRGLGPTSYGQWAVATTLVGVVTFLTNLGLRGAFVRAVARDPKAAAVSLAEQLGLRLSLSLLAASAALVTGLLLGYSHVVIVCTLLSSLGLALLTASTTAADLLQALQRLPTVAGINMAAGVVLTVSSVTAVWLGAGPVGVAACYLAGPLTSLVLLLWVVRRQHFPIRVRWGLRRCLTLLWGARHMASQQLVWSASQYVEALMVPRLVGPTFFGYFSAGALLANRLTAVPEGLSSAAYPAMVSAYRGGARPALRVFMKFMALVLATSVAGAAAVSLLAGPIARLLFQKNPEVCEQVMRISIWLLPAMGAHYMLGYLMNAIDRDSAQARMSAIASAISLVVSAVLVWKFHIVGACWSMVLRYLIHLAVQVPYAVWAFKPLLVAEAAPAAPSEAMAAARAAQVPAL